MKHKHSSDKNFKVSMQVKQMPFSLFLLVLDLFGLLSLFLLLHCPFREPHWWRAWQSSDHELWLTSCCFLLLSSS